MTDEACWQLFADFPHGNLAGCTEDGTPVLRTLNHSISDGALYFHGTLRGEKRGLIGRSAVFGCEEVVAQIPSYWRDTRLACPATTWFRSAQAHGTVDVVEDPRVKARAMMALMDRIQPEGGFVPITSESDEYRKMLKATAVFRLVPTHFTGRLKIGQNKQPDVIQAILSGLWQRGTAQDLRAIETIIAGNPRAQRPAFLTGPGGVEFLVHPSVELAQEAAKLLEGQYWNGDAGIEALAHAQQASPAWIGARDPNTGALIGTAAAISNARKQSYIYDVAVHSAYQARGLGTALVRTLLDHPQIRRTRTVFLKTRDAQAFYTRLGFVDEPNPLDAVTMLRTQ